MPKCFSECPSVPHRKWRGPLLTDTLDKQHPAQNPSQTMQVHLLPSREAWHSVEHETQTSRQHRRHLQDVHSQVAEASGRLITRQTTDSHQPPPLCPSTAAALRSRPPLVPEGKLQHGHPTHATVTNLPTVFLSLILEITKNKKLSSTKRFKNSQYEPRTTLAV